MLYDTEKKLTLYTLFLHEFEKIDQIYNINTYNWTTLPSQISGIWMPYSMMLDEFACELANSINALMLDIQRLSAWAKIIPTLDDDHKMLAAHEFINSIGTNALLSPYVIKSRFAFAIAHLSHQANITWKDRWKDNLPCDRNINFETWNSFTEHWNSYSILKNSFDKIYGKYFVDHSKNFRHIYNHRFSPRIVFGLTGFMKREMNLVTKKIYYEIGATEALQLPTIVDLLKNELDFCFLTFECFQTLVREQTNAIARYSSQSSVVS